MKFDDKTSFLNLFRKIFQIFNSRQLVFILQSLSYISPMISLTDLKPF